MIDVSILIVCYKSRDLILACLEGVYQYTTGCTYEVLLVDCSNDGTVELVKEAYPQTRIIDNSENLGFGKGNNFLAERATGQFLVLLNPDVIVSDNAIGELYRTALAMPEAGTIGGLTRLPDGTWDPSCKQVIPTLYRTLLFALGAGRFLNGGLPDSATEPAEVETLCGAFMLVRSDVWHQVGGFDTSFFMYSEELDLCQRIRKQGWRVVMTPKAVIIHLVGGGDNLGPRRILLLTTARMHFFRKFWAWPYVVMGGILVWMHAAVRVAIGTLGGGLLKRERAQRLRDAYKPIVFQPQTWWYGFRPIVSSSMTTPIPPNQTTLSSDQTASQPGA